MYIMKKISVECYSIYDKMLHYEFSDGGRS